MSPNHSKPTETPLPARSIPFLPIRGFLRRLIQDKWPPIVPEEKLFRFD